MVYLSAHREFTSYYFSEENDSPFARYHSTVDTQVGVIVFLIH